MPRYKLVLEYDGAPFCGWQRQQNGVSVQSVVELALAQLLKADVNAVAAGRTDAGVHAGGMSVHFDYERTLTPEKLAPSINHFLRPYPVAVLEAAAVSDTFHARFSASQRHYSYQLIQRRAPLVLDVGRAWHIPQALDVAALHEATGYLLGKHDFTSFRAIDCQSKSPVKTIDSAVWEVCGERYLFRVAARSFLHHQVRNMVGTLVQVGLGRWKPDDIPRILKARDRAAAGITAPAQGLCLTQVVYQA